MPSAPLGRRQKKNSTTSIVTSLFKLSGLSDMKLHFLRTIILFMSSNNQIYEFRIPNIYN